MAKDKVKVKVDNPWGYILFVGYFGVNAFTGNHGLRAQQDLEHGHDERSADAVPRNVGDDDAEPVLAEFEAVVIIAPDLAGGNVLGCHA